eukprot:1359378-Rhodomonas_salina.1
MRRAISRGLAEAWMVPVGCYALSGVSNPCGAVDVVEFHTRLQIPCSPSVVRPDNPLTPLSRTMTLSFS